MLQALHPYVLHKTFQELTPPTPYIPKSLAWSVKGLPQLAITASLPTAMDTLTESSFLHILKWASSLTSGPWSVLLPACNILPRPHPGLLGRLRSHIQHSSQTHLPEGMPVWFQRARKATQYSVLSSTTHHTEAQSIIFFLIPCPLAFWTFPFLTLIPRHTQFLITSAMKAT